MRLSEQLRCPLFATCVRTFLPLYPFPPHQLKRNRAVPTIINLRFLPALFLPTHTCTHSPNLTPLPQRSFTHIHTLSSDPLSGQKLAKGDVVKLQLGAHIDGFAAISAETIVVGATPNSPVTGRRADALRAAWTAAEIAMRLVRVGNKNWQVTEAVSKVAAAWDCKPVEGAVFFS